MGVNVKRLLYTPVSKYIISIVLGFGLATLFRKVCKDRNCMIFKAPNIKHIQNQIFKYGNKCYKFEPNPRSCKNVNKKIIPFA
jgi:hypothetical protein